MKLQGVQLSPLRMVLELVPGRDLHSILNDPKVDDHTLNWVMRGKLALDVARAMAYLHTSMNPPIIHRDLRTPNVLVSNFDSVQKVCGFYSFCDVDFLFR